MPAPEPRPGDGQSPEARSSGSPITTLTFITTLAHVIVILAAACLPVVARASSVYLNLLDSDSVSSNTMVSSTYDGTRPSPSDKLPIEDLLENPDHSLDPGPEDLNPRVLLRRLGKRFDKKFFSIEEPQNATDSFEYKMKRGRPDSRRPKFLKYLRTFKMADGRRVRLKGGKKQRRRVQKLVWSFTFCPVQYTWKDLGVRFWPRWLREGVCWNGRPCSIPPGMTCKPSDSVNKTLLRWHCQSRKDSKRRAPCRWIAVQYPIITGCSCSC